MATRMLPVFDARPAAVSARPQVAAELAEFTTDDVALPSFHVWTLGLPDEPFGLGGDGRRPVRGGLR